MPTTSPPSLLNLPAEVRQMIYVDVFHETESVLSRDSGCQGSLSWCTGEDESQQHGNCRCGEGLSTANRQLYLETRVLFYNCARFACQNSNDLQTFTRNIGPYISQVGALSIAFGNSTHDLRSVREAIQSLDIIKHLELIITDPDGGRGKHVDYPIYFPAPAGRGGIAAFAYDMSFRPVLHPLETLLQLSSLTVIGRPGSCALEEAIFKTSLNIERIASAIGHGVEVIAQDRDRLFYRIKIV